MRRNNQLVPIERGAVILMWQTMPLACSYYRRPRLELCHGEIIPYLSEEKWRKVGDEGKEGERVGNERERYEWKCLCANEPTHRVPLVFYFDKEPPRLHYTGEWKYRLLCETQCRDIIHYLHPSPSWPDRGICTKIRERHRDGGTIKMEKKQKKRKNLFETFEPRGDINGLLPLRNTVNNWIFSRLSLSFQSRAWNLYENFIQP